MMNFLVLLQDGKSKSVDPDISHASALICHFFVSFCIASQVMTRRKHGVKKARNWLQLILDLFLVRPPTYLKC